MAFYFDQAAATAIAKNLYTRKEIETLVFESPLVGLMPKMTDGEGLQYVGAINSAVMSSVSTQDSIAFTTGSPSVYNPWQCQWKFGYVSANVTGTAIDQSRTDEGALVKIISREFDNGFKAMGIHLGQGIYGNGGGAIGQMASSSTLSGTTIYLANASTVVNFYVGQIVNFSVTNGTGVGSVLSGSLTLTGVDVNNGTLTTNVALNTIVGITTTGFIFNQGDWGNKFIGVGGWIPDVNNRPTSTDSFNGLNRYSDPARLAGVFYSGGGAPKEESLIQTAILVNRMGGKPKHVFMNPLDFADVCKALQSRVIYTTEASFSNPQIGFDAAKVVTPAGPLTLMQDPFCPSGNAYLLDLSEWLMPSMGPVPKILGEGVDGIEWLRQPGLDAYQARIGYRLTTYCAAPGHQGVCTF